LCNRAGYNWQRGNLVYGGELAMSRAEIELVDFPTQEFTRFVDLKGRFGVATGRAMFYGTLGLVRSEFEISPDSSSGSGFSYGIGADMMVSDRIFVGAEFLRRDTRHDETAAILAFDAVIDTVSIRVGMAF
jgi:opacity protein-like surface antigen